jgi:DNA-binding IclR family transcriptional regulator
LKQAHFCYNKIIFGTAISEEKFMITSVEHQPTIRVVDILELLGTSTESLTLTEIANSIGASKSTLLPVIRTLTRRNFILFNKNTYRYSTGLALYCAGASYANGQTAFQFIRIVMEDIVKRSGEICQMGVLEKGQLLYVAKVDSNQPVRIASHVGKRLPAYAAALGKALLAVKTMPEIKKLYPKGMPPCTPKTVTSFTALERQLRRIKIQGYAYECGEVIEQTECFAVPLRKDGVAFAALSVSIPVFRATDEKKDLILLLLKQARDKIESYLNTNNVEIDSFLVNG